MADKTLYLLRHALPDFPGGEAMCLGQKADLPLSREGLAQADALRRRFSSLPVEAVFTSPLLRARQTAEPIAGGGRPLIVLEQLLELDGGAWDGLTFAEIRRRYPRGGTMDRSLPPDAETDESGLRRALSALEIAARRTKRCAVIVAHGAINQVLLCSLSGQPLSEKKQFAQCHAAISVLEYEKGEWRVAAVNLSAEQAE